MQVRCDEEGKRPWATPRRLARGGAAFTRSQRGLLPASPLLPPSRLSSAVSQARVSLSRRSRARPLRWVRTSAVHRKAGTKLNGARIFRGDRPRGCDAIAVIALSLDEGSLSDTKRGRDSLCRPRLQLSSTPRRRPCSRAFLNLLRPPPPSHDLGTGSSGAVRQGDGIAGRSSNPAFLFAERACFCLDDDATRHSDWWWRGEARDGGGGEGDGGGREGNGRGEARGGGGC